jgi:hypothetical protein
MHAANISGIMLFVHVVATKTYMYKDKEVKNVNNCFVNV